MVLSKKDKNNKGSQQKMSDLAKNAIFRFSCGTFRELTFDSRQVTEGGIFVAVRGTQSNGHDFIEMAIEKGAEVVVCEDVPDNTLDKVTYIVVENSAEALGYIAAEKYNNPSAKLKLVGVTGTNGKTTTATLLHEMFRRLGYKVGLLSTVCNYIDDKAVEATHTTPDQIELNRLLSDMVEAGCTHAFMEVSSHAAEQHRIAGLHFTGGVFSNITRDHIDYHKTFEAYLKAKKSFFDALPTEAFALTNIDDRNGMVMLQNTKAHKYTYSTRSIADFKTRILENSFEGMLLDMNGQEVNVPFIGKFNAANLTAVFGTAVLLGEPRLEVLTVLSSLHSVSGRFEAIHASAGFTVIVDYAHTPDALANVIGTINQLLQGVGALITVVGCGGDRDKGKRPMMLREAYDGSSRVIITADNPRSEDPQAIANDMLEALNMAERSRVLTILDRREAIKTACMLAQKGDVVLVAGKGHENYQIIKGVKYHFDDKEVVREMLGLELTEKVNNFLSDVDN